ncbi:sporulation protein YpjB [Paenibacillus gansuensis]|uniref:Sporulation protein YpjB n=1 Tax=Paenibacillus gansuensis TaxID=306542 RepID=A0ABW5PBT2_9BACL
MLSNMRWGWILLLLYAGAAIALSGCGNENRSAYMTLAGVEQNEEFQKTNQLNQAADKMYKAVYAAESFEEILAIRQELNKFGVRLVKVNFTGITSKDGARALYDTLLAAQTEFNRVQFDQEQAIKAIARLRLATDALTHPTQPMWLQYYRGIGEVVDQLDQAVKASDWGRAITGFNDLKEHYAFIRPAVLVQRPVQEEEKVTFTLKYLENELSEPDISKRQVLIGISNLRMMLSDLFAKKDTAVYSAAVSPGNPWIWSSAIGAAILTVLTYVGYVRYRHERNYVPVRKERRGGKVYTLF